MGKQEKDEDIGNSSDKNDHLKYVISSSKDFHRIPRWPNDGIEQFKKDEKRHYQKNSDDVPLVSPPDAIVNPLQKEVTEILGSWPFGKPLSKEAPSDEGDGFMVSLPFTIQKSSAEKEQDLEAAKKHLLNVYKDKKKNKKKQRAVFHLLEKLGCRSAVHKASYDERRFPAMESIIVQLFQNNLATDANVRLLFGEVRYVRGLLFEVGSMFFEPLDPMCPAAGFLAQHTQQKTKPAPKECAECGTTKGELEKCSACRTVHYCGKTCQVKAWKIHKPDCLRAQGKVVSDKTQSAAERAIQAKKEAAIGRQQEEKEAYERTALEGMRAFLIEGPEYADAWYYDCNGKLLKAHLPQFGVNLELFAAKNVGLEGGEVLSLGVFPDGIDHEKYNFRGALFTDPGNDCGHGEGAKIMVLHTFLYESAIVLCDVIAYAIDGIFVVENVVGRRAKWKRVSEPTYLPAGSYTRLEFFEEYLRNAKQEAKSVPSEVDLGIHNPGDPSLDVVQTAMGQYMRPRN